MKLCDSPWRLGFNLTGFDYQERKKGGGLEMSDENLGDSLLLEAGLSRIDSFTSVI